MQRIFFVALIISSLIVVPCWGNTMKSIGKEKVNIRNGPGLNNEVLFQAHLGYPLQIEKRKGDWVYFKDWMGNTGWVYRPLLKDIQTAVVLKDNVNVRRGPGLNHRVVTQVNRGEVYKIFQRNSNWVKIGYYLEGEEIGWIRNDLVWGD